MCTIWNKLHQPRVYLTVEPVLFIYSFASFLSYTVFQELLHHLVCLRTPNCSTTQPRLINVSSFSSHVDLLSHHGEDACGDSSSVEQTVQTVTSHWLLFYNIASGIPTIIVSVFYGAASDLKGRRVFMIIPVLGMILNQVVVLLAVHFPATFPLPFLLLGALLSGLSGSFSVFIFATFSYVSDVSAQSKRTAQLSILESMTFLGSSLSMLLGGRWVENNNFSGPLYCIIAIDLVIVLYVIVALPESLEMAHSRENTDRTVLFRQSYDYSPSSSLRQPYPWQLYPQQPIGSRLCAMSPCVLVIASFKKLGSFLKLLSRSWRLFLLLGMFFVVEMNFEGITDTAILFTLGRPLCWGTALIGYFLASKVFMNGLATLFLVPLLSLFGLRDSWLVVIGLLSGAAGLILMGLSTHTWMMFTVPVVAAMRGFVVPVIRSMLSKTTPVDLQGVLFSGVSVVEATCALLASVIYNSLYPVTRSVLPGLIFYIMAGALVIPLVLTLILELNRRGVCQAVGREEEDPLLRHTF